MSDIRKHGFDTNQQWEEHLEEIEHHTAETEDYRRAQAVQRDLDTMRTEVAALRRVVDARRAMSSRRSHLPFSASALVVAMAAGIAVLWSEHKVSGRV